VDWVMRVRGLSFRHAVEVLDLVKKMESLSL
jgi:hypothetical protein